MVVDSPTTSLAFSMVNGDNKWSLKEVTSNAAR